MAQGKIVQCIGAVVDVEFPREQMPRIYDALRQDPYAKPSADVFAELAQVLRP